MKMSLRLLVAASMLALGFSMAACEMSESCDPATDPNCVPADAGPDQTTDQGTDQQQFQTYHYVLIQDLDRNASGDRPGADIDGVELDKGGSPLYLTQIHESAFGPEPPSGANRNFSNALGRPEGTCIGQDPADQDPTTFVSLGGEGGYLIGSFGSLAEIDTGDEITVHVCSAPLSESWDAFVGVGTTLSDPNWVRVIQGGVGVTSGTVPNLPQIPLN